MSYAAEVMADSPVWYLKLDELSGTVAHDSSLSAKNGTYGGRTTLGGTNSPSTLGSTAAWFTNTYSSKVTRAADNLLNVGDVFTMEAFVRISDLSDGTYRPIVNGPGEMRLEPDNSLSLINFGVSATCYGTTQIADTDWHHVAATKNGDAVHLYIDGVDVSGSVTNSDYSGKNGTRYVGFDGDGFLANGGLSDAAIYPTALSQARILAHIAAANGVPSDPPPPPSGHPLNTQPPFTTPTDYTTITSQMVFYPGDDVVLTLDKATATAYSVRDYSGAIVASGAVTGTTLDLGSGYGLGWYRVYLTGPTTGATFDEAYGVYAFAVVRENAAFPTYPVDAFLQEDPVWTIAGGEARDPITKGVFGMGLSRLQIGDASLTDPDDPYLPGTSDPVTQRAINSLYACQLGAAAQLLWRPDDPARTWPLMCQFPDRTTDFLTLADYFPFVFVKDGTIDGSQVYVRSGPGSVSGSRIRVYSPDSSTLVEDWDNHATQAAMKAAINAGSDYIWVGGDGANTAPTTSATAIGNDYYNGVVAAVQALVPEGVLHYEGPSNEPGFNEVTAHASKLFAAAVHAADPTAIAQGPCFVTASQPDSLRTFLDACIADGGSFPLDEISIHFYNSQPFGDFNVGRQTLQDFRDVLEEYGLDDLPIWNTESLMTGLPGYGIFQPRFSKIPLSMALLMEQYGIERERNHYWYDASHGFWDVPTWFRNGDMSVHPFALLFRVLEEETLGKTHHHAIDFGSVQGNTLYIGSVYAEPQVASGVAVFQARCILNDQTITLGVSGDIDQLVVVDGWGNETATPVVAGFATVTTDEIPTYVRLPFGVNVWVDSVHDWGANPPASSGQFGRGRLSEIQYAPALVDGSFYTNEVFGTGLVVAAAEPPDVADVIWNEPVDVDRVIIIGFGTSLTDFDVQTTTNGVDFTTRATLNQVSDVSDVTFWHPSTLTNTGTSWESYWDNRWAFDVPLGGTFSATGIRVNVRDTTCRGAPTTEISDSGYGYLPGEPKHIGFQEIIVPSASTPAPFSADYDDLVLGTTGLIELWKLTDDASGGVLAATVHSPLLDGIMGTHVAHQKSGPVADGSGAILTVGPYLGLPEEYVMVVPYNALLNTGDTFSVEAWINTRNTSGGWGGIFIGQHFTIGIGEGGMTLEYGGTHVATTSIGFADGNWHHVVVAKDGADTKIYIDAVDVTVLETNHTFADTGDSFAVGFGTSAEQWYGRIAYYNVQLSESDVIDHFNAASVVTVEPSIDSDYTNPNPRLTGTAAVGSQVQSSSGYWQSAPTAFSYQWQDSLDGLTANASLAGRTRSDYIVGADDLGRWLRVGVVATNAAGSSTEVFSDWVGPVAAEVIPPTDDDGIVIYGIAVVDGVPTFIRCRENP